MALRKQLPVTFRITGIGKFANDFRDKLQANLFSHFSHGDILVRAALIGASAWIRQQGAPSYRII